MAKNKPVKDDWIGSRVDGEFKETVEDYIDEADLTMGLLIRKAVQEYMDNHPIVEKEG